MHDCIWDRNKQIKAASQDVKHMEMVPLSARDKGTRMADLKEVLLEH